MRKILILLVFFSLMSGGCNFPYCHYVYNPDPGAIPPDGPGDDEALTLPDDPIIDPEPETDPIDPPPAEKVSFTAYTVRLRETLIGDAKPTSGVNANLADVNDFTRMWEERKFVGTNPVIVNGKGSITVMRDRGALSKSNYIGNAVMLVPDPDKQYTVSYVANANDSTGYQLTIWYADGTQTYCGSPGINADKSVVQVSTFGKKVLGVGISYSSQVSGAVCTFTNIKIEEYGVLTPYIPFGDATKAVANNRDIFMSRNYANRASTRNPNLVLSGVNLAPFPFANSWNANGQGGGCLITPRHMIAAQHYSGTCKVGDTQLFAAMDNTVHARKITHVKNVGGDIKLCQLDEDLPAEIGFARVLPKDYAAYLSDAVGYNRITGFYSDKNKRVYVASVRFGNSFTLSNQRITPVGGTMFDQDDQGRNISVATDPWYTTVVSGDSGSPVWFVDADNNMVLIGTFYTATSGPFVSAYYDAINDQLKAWGSDYRLTDADMTPYVKTEKETP